MALGKLTCATVADIGSPVADRRDCTSTLARLYCLYGDSGIQKGARCWFLIQGPSTLTCQYLRAKQLSSPAKVSLIINYGPHPWVSIFVCQGKVRLCAIGQIALMSSPAFAPRVGWAFTSVQSNQCVATATQGGLMLQTMLLTSSSSSESVRRQLLPSVPQPTAFNAVHTV